MTGAPATQAKGLQKLRWYCQACQKQCRDENGFKNHITSQSHQRQMMVVSENASKYIEEYSKQVGAARRSPQPAARSA